MEGKINIQEYLIIRTLKDNEFAVNLEISRPLFSHFQTTPDARDLRLSLKEIKREIFYKLIQ